MAVMTVLGKKEAGELGICAPHEHIYIDMSVFFVPPEELGMKNLAYKPVTMESLGVLKRNPFAVLDNVLSLIHILWLRWDWLWLCPSRSSLGISFF